MVNPDNAAAIATNPTDVLFWRLANGRRTVDDIVNGVRNRFLDAPGSVIDTVNVYPNLVWGPAMVHYTLKKDCNVTIGLYDATGRLAARVPTSGFKKGPNTARLDASGLARGVYFVKVKGETDSQTTKVIIE